MINFVTGFRESLEAIILISIVLSVINKYEKDNLKEKLYLGVISGIVASVAIALGLNYLEGIVEETTEVIEKLWEVGASFVVAILIATLVYYMIKNGNSIVENTKEKVNENLTGIQIFLLSFLMVAREGFEIVLFSMAQPTPNGLILVLIGILSGVVLGVLLYKSIINVSLSKIFKITLFYLIIQVGYLLGMATYELIELLEIKGLFLNSPILYGRVYDLSATILNTKESILGILLNTVLGWVSSPYILQFLVQYTITLLLFYQYRKYNKKDK